MNFKKVLIFVLLFSSTWIVNSNDIDNDSEDEDNNISSSSDESEVGKLKFRKL